MEPESQNDAGEILNQVSAAVLLIVGEPATADHKNLILGEITKGKVKILRLSFFADLTGRFYFHFVFFYVLLFKILSGDGDKTFMLSLLFQLQIFLLKMHLIS